MRRPKVTGAVVVGAVAVLGLTLLSPGATVVAVKPSVCPVGQLKEPDSSLSQFAGGQTFTCRAPNTTAENSTEMIAANEELQTRHQGAYAVSADAAASAATQAQAIAAQGRFTDATWTPLGNDALYANDPAYASTVSDGFGNLSGRIQSFASKSATTWFAAVANGGVQKTDDAGGSWHSIGDSLATQIVGALAYDNGTLIVGTGDPAFGGDSYSGLGAFWSADDGTTWNQATGLPNGTITFRVAVDPTNPAIVYQATGKGLWRSTDTGRSYTNVALPTGTCTDVTNAACFFDNIVSDVVVKPAGGGGTSAADKGGEVMAAVGWRAGTIANAQGLPEAQQDGIYTSTTGAPGTFTFTDPGTTGFPAVVNAGRTALGEAIGAGQDHNYVYALVEDPQKFNKQTGTANLPVLPTGNSTVTAVLAPSVLNGLYISTDFGVTWTLMADQTQLQAPYHGSALGGTECTLGYCAGVQSWYNEWVQPDPSANLTNADGSPSFLAFGLEEIWGGSAAKPAVADTSDFGVFGRYYSGTTCAALTLTELMGFCPTTDATGIQGSTVHPDQHAAMFVPDATGNLDTLVVGSDGGAYKQHNNGQTFGMTVVGPTAGVTSTSPYDNDSWGDGINHGLHTLLPYDAEMSKDGTVFGGLQDNGELKISPDGSQNSVYGGDGFFSAVDPTNSKIAYEEYTEGDISVTQDGGATWTDIQPCYTTAQFSAPFKLDPANANHIVAGGSDIEDSLSGPSTTSEVDLGLTATDKMATCSAAADTGGSTTDWVPVFSLGTTNGYTNTASAVDVAGDAEYAGFCGSCDIVTQGLPFHSGLATNVGGSAAPKAGTSAGWHVAAAAGLPQRIINSVTIDPTDAKTVYVTLGGYGRRWIPPGSLGDSTALVGTGHLFVSHDAGATFTDISGNLPDAAADWAIVHQGDLIVGTDVGVFGAKGTNGGTFSVVGTGLPNVPVVHLEITPRSPNELLAATYGRGDQLIELTPGSNPAGGTTGQIPVNVTTTLPPTKAGSGSLASTGLSGLLPWTALVVIAGGAGVLTRRRRRHEA